MDPWPKKGLDELHDKELIRLVVSHSAQMIYPQLPVRKLLQQLKKNRNEVGIRIGDGGQPNVVVPLHITIL